MSKDIDVFIGKNLDIVKAKANDFYYNDESYDDPILEKFLYMDVGFDEHGYNGYSVIIVVDGNKIKGIQRIAHCHMKGGQGADDDIDEFPHDVLEVDAFIEIEAIIETN